ncbi:MAG: hypothetical protein J4G18_16790, partial [Anaerolineae bacterium]|nr:hypothetical protein [Anaerolineae bacterium]
AGGQLWLLRAESESPLRLNAGGAGPPLQVAFAAGGANFATVHAQHVLLWDAASAAALGAYPLGDASADKLDLAFSPDGEKLYFFVRLQGGLAGLTAVAIADNSVRRRAFLDVAYGEPSRSQRRPLPDCRHGNWRHSAHAVSEGFRDPIAAFASRARPAAGVVRK